MALSIYFQIYLRAAMASFQVLVNTFPQPQTSNALFLSGDSTEGSCSSKCNLVILQLTNF